MKNVTLAIEDNVLLAARRYRPNTTVNGMVREYLTRLANFEDRAANARPHLRELAEESSLDLGSWK